MNIVLFKEEEIESPLLKGDARFEHIKKVLHKNVGDTFDAGIIGGKSGKATITAIDANSLTFEFLPTKEEKPLFPIHLVVGFPRPIQLKRLLRDVSSLGVCAIHLTGTELGEKSYQKSTLVERGAALTALLDGAAQAKTTFVPELVMHKTLEDCFKNLSALDTLAVPKEYILLDTLGAKHHLSQLACCHAFEGKAVVLAIGSERGWTDNERLLFAQKKFTTCSLGERILRTETACTAAVSIVLAGMNVI